MSARRTFREGGKFEDVAAYSRAVRVGSRIVVSGTAALGHDGSVLFPGDTLGQTQAALKRALGAVEQLGGKPSDVILTRMYLISSADWIGAVEAHRMIFADINPANTTLFVAGFVPDDVLVEVELEAVLAS